MKAIPSPRVSPIAVLLLALGLALAPSAASAAGQSHRLAPGPRPVLVSRASGAIGKPSQAARAGALSADGRYATFQNGNEIFIRDLRTQRTRRVGEGGYAVLSADAHHLAYTVDGKLFVRNLRTGSKSLVTDQISTSPPSISADGRYVTFAATIRNYPDQGVSPYQVYLRDLKQKKTTLISRANGADGSVGDGESSAPSISANGRYLAFASDADNLLPGPSRPFYGIYVRDLRTDRTRLVSYWHSKPLPHRTDAHRPAISANGRYVAFEFVRLGGPPSVVVRDLRTGAVVNASLLTRTPLKLAFGTPAISPDGRFLAFRAGPAKEGLERLYLVDLQSRRTRYVGQVSTNEGGPLSFSAGGRYLLFDTFIETSVPKGNAPFVPSSGEVYRYENPLVG